MQTEPSRAFTVVIGTGYTGRRVLESLPHGDALGLSRTPVQSSHRIETFDLDGDAPLPVELPDDYAVLYTVPPGGSPADTRLQRLLATLSPNPGRFVYISTTGVYGNRDGAIVTEATQPRPETERAKRRVIAEQMLGRWCSENAVEFVILRAPGIYGPGRLGIERIEQGVSILREEDANPGNRIHVDDLVQCCLAALDPEVPSGVYNVGDGDQRSTTWFVKEVARQCGLETPPEISRRQAIEEFSATRLSFLAESRRVDTTRMRDILGVEPLYANPEDGIKASLPES